MANFVVSGTPHVRSKESIQSIMRDVIIALVPATAAGIYYFGISALILIIAAIVSSVVFEALCQKIMKKPVTVSDLSAVVTGLLLAMNLPAAAPIWVAVVGSAFAIVFGKQLFGGLGQNFINPALAGRAFLLASYPTEMTTWSVPNGLEVADAATNWTGTPTNAVVSDDEAVPAQSILENCDATVVIKREGTKLTVNGTFTNGTNTATWTAEVDEAQLPEEINLHLGGEFCKLTGVSYK